MILPIDPVPLITLQAGYYRMTDWGKVGLVVSFLWVGAATISILTIGKFLGLV